MLKDHKVIQAEARYLDPAEVAKFRQAIKDSPRDDLLFSAYIMTGCRLRELLNLNVADARNKNVITIVGKGGKTRQIFLNGYLTDLVGKVIAGCADSAPLFVSALTNRLSASRVQALLKHYCAAAGVKQISPHGLRHTFLTALYDRTKDILLCQQAAGHSQVRTTQRYCHIAPHQVQSAVTGLWEAA
jgi:site-specific recombinase XerD